MKNVFLILFGLASCLAVSAQNVGIGTTTPNAKAALEINSSDKGLLMPRLGLAQRTAISNPPKGLMVYDTTYSAFYYYDGGRWLPFYEQNYDSATIDYINTAVLAVNLSPVSNNNFFISRTQNSGFIYDNGGPAGNYLANSSSSATITKDDSTLLIKIVVEDMATEPFYDSLFLISGADINDLDTIGLNNTQTGSYSFTTTVRVLFKANAINQQAGFRIRWARVKANVPTQQPAPLFGWHFNAQKIGAMGGVQQDNNWDTDSVGLYSLSYGNGAKAKGYTSFATGRYTAATGSYSTAQGYGSTASGLYASALNYLTTASGSTSFATGNRTTASGNYSTAMGTTAIASGQYSTSIGVNTEAIGDYSNAMGQSTKASGRNSVAMGVGTNATADYATAMGTVTNATGLYSTALGWETTAAGISSMATGYQSTATGDYATALGFVTTAGNYSTAMGKSTEATAAGSTSMGESTKAYGLNSTAMGIGSNASGKSSTAMGNYTFANGAFSTAMGGATTATGTSSTVMGSFNTARAYSSTTIGIYNDSVATSSPTAWINSDPLFIIGNGTFSTRSNAMVILKNGNVAIGNNSSPVTPLHITAPISNVSLAAGTGAVTLGATNSSNMVIDQNDIQVRQNGAAAYLSLQRLGGNVSIGLNVAPAYQLEITGTAGKPGGGTWSNASDKRLKENVMPYTDGLAAILNIKPVWYNYNLQSGFDTKKKYVGVLAQDLQAVSPYMVSASAGSKAPDGSSYLQVDNSAMTYMLINAVQEQQKEIEELKKLVKELLKK